MPKAQQQVSTKFFDHVVAKMVYTQNFSFPIYLTGIGKDGLILQYRYGSLEEGAITIVENIPDAMDMTPMTIVLLSQDLTISLLRVTWDESRNVESYETLGVHRQGSSASDPLEEWVARCS